MRGGVLLSLVYCLACSGAPAPSSTPAALAPHEAPAAPAPSTPQLEIQRDRVLLDGAPIESSAPNELRRLDALFARLGQLRAGLDPAAVPGYRLSFSDDVPPAQLKSALQTAAHAGWPSAWVATSTRSMRLLAVLPNSIEPSPEAAKIAVSVRRHDVELWMAASILAEHGGSMGSGGLLVGGPRTPGTMVRATSWSVEDAAASVAGFREYCSQAAPCPVAGLRIHNQVTGAQLRGVLEGFGRACTEAQVRDCALELSVQEPGAPN